MHEIPSPFQPTLQAQVKEPSVFVQLALLSQLWLLSVHSSASVSINEIHNVYSKYFQLLKCSNVVIRSPEVQSIQMWGIWKCDASFLNWYWIFSKFESLFFASLYISHSHHPFYLFQFIVDGVEISFEHLSEGDKGYDKNWLSRAFKCLKKKWKNDTFSKYGSIKFEIAILCLIVHQ